MKRGEVVGELRAMRRIMGWMSAYQNALVDLFQERGIVTDKDIVALMKEKVGEHSLIIDTLMAGVMGEVDA